MSTKTTAQFLVNELLQTSGSLVQMAANVSKNETIASEDLTTLQTAIDELIALDSVVREQTE